MKNTNREILNARAEHKRKQTKKMEELYKEYKALRDKIFGTHTFVVDQPDSKDHKRYNQLFQFFYPPYRTKDFINPLN